MEKSKKASGNMYGPLISRLKSTSLSLPPICYWPKSISWPHSKSRLRKVQLAHCEASKGVDAGKGEKLEPIMQSTIAAR